MTTLTEDAAAREINAQPWQPLPGMTKVRCSHSNFWFAAVDADTAHCLDCQLALARRGRKAALMEDERA